MVALRLTLSGWSAFGSQVAAIVEPGAVAEIAKALRGQPLRSSRKSAGLVDSVPAARHEPDYETEIFAVTPFGARRLAISTMSEMSL